MASIERTADVLVIGGGIAGASAAAHLSEFAQVILIERETQPGYHSTGRSSATYTETYGNRTIGILTRASRPFFESNAEGMTEHPILTPRGLLYFAMCGETSGLEALWKRVSPLDPTICRLNGKETVELVPILNSDSIEMAVYEPRAMDIDVHALHDAYLRRIRRNGGAIVLDTGVTAIKRGRTWAVRTQNGDFDAPVVVNAAGAWAEEIAGLAGLPPIGLVPQRRTALIVVPSGNIDIRPWALVVSNPETFYFKPEVGKLFLSPSDETPSPPCDAQPDELDVATAIDRLERATTIKVKKVERKWAGLRSFVPDRTPVVGFDPLTEGFFWLAGQGGYGVHTAPAMARCAAALVQNGSLPGDIINLGLEAGVLSPARFRNNA